MESCPSEHRTQKAASYRTCEISKKGRRQQKAAFFNAIGVNLPPEDSKAETMKIHEVEHG